MNSNFEYDDEGENIVKQIFQKRHFPTPSSSSDVLNKELEKTHNRRNFSEIKPVETDKIQQEFEETSALRKSYFSAVAHKNHYFKTFTTESILQKKCILENLFEDISKSSKKNSPKITTHETLSGFSTRSELKKKKKRFLGKPKHIEQTLIHFHGSQKLHAKYLEFDRITKVSRGLLLSRIQELSSQPKNEDGPPDITDVQLKETVKRIKTAKNKPNNNYDNVWYDPTGDWIREVAQLNVEQNQRIKNELDEYKKKLTHFMKLQKKKKEDSKVLGEIHNVNKLLKRQEDEYFKGLYQEEELDIQKFMKNEIGKFKNTLIQKEVERIKQNRRSKRRERIRRLKKKVFSILAENYVAEKVKKAKKILSLKKKRRIFSEFRTYTKAVKYNERYIKIKCFQVLKSEVNFSFFLNKKLSSIFRRVQANRIVVLTFKLWKNYSIYRKAKKKKNMKFFLFNTSMTNDGNPYWQSFLTRKREDFLKNERARMFLHTLLRKKTFSALVTYTSTVKKHRHIIKTFALKRELRYKKNVFLALKNNLKEIKLYEKPKIFIKKKFFTLWFKQVQLEKTHDRFVKYTLPRVKKVCFFWIWKRKYLRKKLLETVSTTKHLIYQNKTLYTLALLKNDNIQTNLIQKFRRWKTYYIRRKFLQTYIAFMYQQKEREIMKYYFLRLKYYAKYSGEVVPRHFECKYEVYDNFRVFKRAFHADYDEKRTFKKEFRFRHKRKLVKKYYEKWLRDGRDAVIINNLLVCYIEDMKRKEMLKKNAVRIDLRKRTNEIVNGGERSAGRGTGVGGRPKKKKNFVKKKKVDNRSSVSSVTTDEGDETDDEGPVGVVKFNLKRENSVNDVIEKLKDMEIIFETFQSDEIEEFPEDHQITTRPVVDSNGNATKTPNPSQGPKKKIQSTLKNSVKKNDEESNNKNNSIDRFSRKGRSLRDGGSKLKKEAEYFSELEKTDIVIAGIEELKRDYEFSIENEKIRMKKKNIKISEAKDILEIFEKRDKKSPQKFKSNFVSSKSGKGGKNVGKGNEDKIVNFISSSVQKNFVRNKTKFQRDRKIVKKFCVKNNIDFDDPMLNSSISSALNVSSTNDFVISKGVEMNVNDSNDASVEGGDKPRNIVQNSFYNMKGFTLNFAHHDTLSLLKKSTSSDRVMDVLFSDESHPELENGVNYNNRPQDNRPPSLQEENLGKVQYNFPLLKLRESKSKKFHIREKKKRPSSSGSTGGKRGGKKNPTVERNNSTVGGFEKKNDDVSSIKSNSRPTTSSSVKSNSRPTSSSSSLSRKRTFDSANDVKSNQKNANQKTGHIINFRSSVDRNTGAGKRGAGKRVDSVKTLKRLAKREMVERRNAELVEKRSKILREKERRKKALKEREKKKNKKSKFEYSNDNRPTMFNNSLKGNTKEPKIKSSQNKLMSSLMKKMDIKLSPEKEKMKKKKLQIKKRNLKKQKKRLEGGPTKYGDKIKPNIGQPFENPKERLLFEKKLIGMHLRDGRIKNEGRIKLERNRAILMKRNEVERRNEEDVLTLVEKERNYLREKMEELKKKEKILRKKKFQIFSQKKKFYKKKKHKNSNSIEKWGDNLFKGLSALSKSPNTLPPSPTPLPDPSTDDYDSSEDENTSSDVEVTRRKEEERQVINEMIENNVQKEVLMMIKGLKINSISVMNELCSGIIKKIISQREKEYQEIRNARERMKREIARVGKSETYETTLNKSVRSRKEKESYIIEIKSVYSSFRRKKKSQLKNPSLSIYEKHLIQKEIKEKAQRMAEKRKKESFNEKLKSKILDSKTQENVYRDILKQRAMAGSGYGRNRYVDKRLYVSGMTPREREGNVSGIGTNMIQNRSLMVTRRPKSSNVVGRRRKYDAPKPVKHSLEYIYDFKMKMKKKEAEKIRQKVIELRRVVLPLIERSKKVKKKGDKSGTDHEEKREIEQIHKSFLKFEKEKKKLTLPKLERNKSFVDINIQKASGYSLNKIL